MDVVNFPGIIANGMLLDQSQIDPTKDLILIGKKVNDRRDGSQYQEMAIPVGDLISPPTPSILQTGKYRLSEFPDTMIPKTVFNENTVGKVFDISGSLPFLFPSFYETLENDTIVIVYYNNSILKSGIMIFEAYEVLDPNILYPPGYIDGWWVAYKQDPNNLTKLIKVGEVKMTQQFWDNWYTWTAKDSGDNVVKFIETNPYDEFQNLQTFTTTVTYTGSGLTAVDSIFNYGGATVRSLYESLTGLTPLLMNIQYYPPEWILDDDYYGMAMGAEAGWYYYRNNTPDLSVDQWFIVGFNLLTGATKAFNIVPALSTLTNWSYSLPGGEEFAPTTLRNHPNGIFVSLDDGRLCDNGDNYDGVTSIWSPYWTSNTEVIYLGIRDQDTGNRALVSGNINIFNWYWDNVAVYFVNYMTNLTSDQGYICYKYDTNTKQTTLYEVPYLPGLLAVDLDISSTYLNMWANNDGLFINVRSFSLSTPSWSSELYQYVKHKDSTLYSFHFDYRYPTHAFNDKIININTFATYNINTLGVPISTYKNMKF